MNKENLSFADVERLLAELAQHDRQDDAQTELMRGAARGEICRVFRRRRCLRAAGDMAAVGALGGALFFLLPEEGEEPALATSATPVVPVEPPPAVASTVRVEKNRSFDCSTDACEVIIYSVPL